MMTSRGKRRAVVILSDSDCDSGVDEDVSGIIAKEDARGSPKSRKPSKKSIKGLGLSRKGLTASSNGNGAKAAQAQNVERFVRRERAEVGGAFAWPTFQPPAKKPKLDPAPDSNPERRGTQDSLLLKTPRTTIWADKYFPALEEELAVQKKKVGEVKAWLESCQSGSSSSKVLLLVGPPGAGKSTTVHVLCKPLNLQVTEWQTPVPTLWEEHVHHRGVGPGYSSKLDDFDAFLDKAEKFPLVPLVPSLATLTLDPQTSNGSPPNMKLSQQVPQGKVVLIDDMPLAAEGDRRQRLCDSLEILARSARFPTVVILSEGQAGQSGQGDNQPRWGATAAFQQALERGGAARISFNDITKANICKVLRRVANEERYDPPEEDLAAIAEESGGDLRQALATLQFHCLGQSQSAKPVKKAKKKKAAAKRGKKGALEDSEDVGQNGTQASVVEDDLGVPDSQAENRPELRGRDSGLSLFRALGKFLYNKRVDADVSGQVSANGDVSGDQALREELRRRPMASAQPPEATLARAHLDGPAVTAFLHENVLHFVDDDAIDDVSVTSAYFSDADHILRRRAGGARASPAEDQGAEPDPGRVGHAAAAAIAARGVLFGIVHPAPRKWQAFRAPVSGQVERRRLETLAQIQRASLSQSSSYLAPGAAGSAVLALELLPFMKHIEALRRWKAANGEGTARQEESLEHGISLSTWGPVFEIDRRKESAEVEEEAEEIEEW
ncbi:Checkpoint RAD17-RFC complex RAD17/RAD24 component [Klebsormidium nitens]|uniref:Checkpoint RAD17-RFC complex RAD17/RAD24 component n=1 Tax=Klebsormidium nitens TaxID=105231 RepID=A0A1Y1HSP2_KLENI|nr:Checkpoint RAD17-RFC complex RAD17/RAD24 component [Klebsormidium nitens]|eukprot:GAQ81645.1 Checkpoint RAD17-RFC complex RAD17/RAD24 component [Klebsormidium nitens]